MKKLWHFKFENNDVRNVVFKGSSLFLSVENVLFCFNSNGIRWNRKMSATFYRDPYCDVTISALDAGEGYVAAGTNFMDGKLYLFDYHGKLLWEHQFATIASLGWRPEDITSIKVKNPYIAVGTEFTNEYVHVYTTNRKRILNKRVKGRVEDISFLGERLVVGTESYLYNFSINGEREHTIDTPARKVETQDNLIFVLNNYGVITFKLSSRGKIKKYWSIKSDSRNSDFCLAEDGILLVSENKMLSISKSGILEWIKEFDRKIECVYFDRVSGRIYAGTEGDLEIFSPNGELVKRTGIAGKVVKIGRLNNVESTLVLLWNGRLTLYRAD